jgi:hypothetical protein
MPVSSSLIARGIRNLVIIETRLFNKAAVESNFCETQIMNHHNNSFVFASAYTEILQEMRQVTGNSSKTSRHAINECNENSDIKFSS